MSETNKYIVSQDIVAFKNPEPNENCVIMEAFSDLHCSF